MGVWVTKGDVSLSMRVCGARLEGVLPCILAKYWLYLPCILANIWIKYPCILAKYRQSLCNSMINRMCYDSRHSA